MNKFAFALPSDACGLSCEKIISLRHWSPKVEAFKLNCKTHGDVCAASCFAKTALIKNYNATVWISHTVSTLRDSLSV